MAFGGHGTPFHSGHRTPFHSGHRTPFHSGHRTPFGRFGRFAIPGIASETSEKKKLAVLGPSARAVPPSARTHTRRAHGRLARLHAALRAWRHARCSASRARAWRPWPTLFARYAENPCLTFRLSTQHFSHELVATVMPKSVTREVAPLKRKLQILSVGLIDCLTMAQCTARCKRHFSIRVID